MHTAQAFRNQDNYTATAAPTRGCARLHCITTLQCPRKPLVRRRTAHFTRTCLHNRRSQKSRLPHSAEKRRTGAVRGHRSKQRLWQKTKSFVIARRRGKASSRWGLTSQGSRRMPIEANLRYRSGYQSIAPDRRNAQIAAEQASATIQRRAGTHASRRRRNRRGLARIPAARGPAGATMGRKALKQRRRR